MALKNKVKKKKGVIAKKVIKNRIKRSGRQMTRFFLLKEKQAYSS
jgi:hypothetical protein